MDPVQQQAVHLAEINTALGNPGDLKKLRALLIKHHNTLKTNVSYQQDLYDKVQNSTHPQPLKIDLICTLAIHDIQFADPQFENIIKPIFNDKNVFWFWSYPPKTRFWELFDEWVKEGEHRAAYKSLLQTAYENPKRSPWHRIIAMPRSWRFQPYTNDADTTHVSSLELLEDRYNLWIKNLDPRIERLRKQQAPNDSGLAHYWPFSRLQM